MAADARSSWRHTEPQAAGKEVLALVSAVADSVRKPIRKRRHSPGSEVTDLAAVGVVVGDGNGHATGDDWASVNGAKTARTLTATYTVDPDYTGTAHGVFTPGGVVDVFFALADHNRVVKAIQTTPGGVVSGDEIRQ